MKSSMPRGAWSGFAGKKYFIIAAILLLAASCNKPQPVSTGQNPPPQNQASSTPPDVTAGWNTYEGPDKYGFSIKYPTDFGFNSDIRQFASMGINIEPCDDTDEISGTFAGCALYVGSDYQNTTFEAAGVSVYLDSGLDSEPKCYNFSSQYNEAQTAVPDVIINSVVFKSVTGGGRAAGTSDKLQVYRNLHNGSCYEIDQSVFQSGVNPVGSPPKNVNQFDLNAVWQKLQSVVNAFGFTGQSQATGLSLSIKYSNTQYGFVFSLPADWQGYSVYTKQWSGNPLQGSSYTKTITGPEIYIRNPNWTAQNPYEDIPVMVFTIAEWNEVSQEKLAVSAAPFPPSELGRNKTYVFALPPRYDYDYRTGYQEVEKIMQSNPLNAY